MHPLVTRLPLRLTPDSSRVITRFFNPGDLTRSRDIIERVLSFPEHDIRERLTELERTFGLNHPDIHAVFAENFQHIQAAIPVDSRLSQAQQLLIGACFTMEYAIESVALFNPSIVPAFVQEGAPPGGIRFLMSLRAIGEGHLSSIVFRTGVIDAAGEVQLDVAGAYSKTLKATLPDKFCKSIYRAIWRHSEFRKSNSCRSWTNSETGSLAINSLRRSMQNVRFENHRGFLNRPRTR